MCFDRIAIGEMCVVSHIRFPNAAGLVTAHHAMPADAFINACSHCDFNAEEE